ncbi:hypothetical protein JTB14_016402 [Gonioctena quinquepunctata]|nr:hypothetical protein JTB14_016402 [Gonioctena quinquepunctata]
MCFSIFFHISQPTKTVHFGKLHLPTNKAGIRQCLDQPGQSEPPSTYDSKFLDGSVIVNCLPTTSVDTFNQYADKIFLPYLYKQLENSQRLDVVWDTYISDSLKESTREKRGEGIRRKVSGNTELPRNWMDFLRDSMNKTESLNFLTFKIVEFKWPPGKDIYVTSGKSVAQIGSHIPMENCNHEEADTRIVVRSCTTFTTARGNEYSSTHPFQLLKADSDHFQKLERLTAVLYDKTTPFSSINQKRKELFCEKNRAMDKLPPTEDALYAVYQAGIWTTSTQTQQVIPSLHDFARNKVLESWIPVWMTIPEV